MGQMQLTERDFDRTRQSKRVRSCMLVSLKDNKQYIFESFRDADAFLNKQHGYTGGKYRAGIKAVKLYEDGNKEFFDIIAGESHRAYRTTAVVREQLCWSCANCYGGCSWSREFKPVEGWTAKRSIKADVDTYSIIKCPEYCYDGPEMEEE